MLMIKSQAVCPETYLNINYLPLSHRPDITGMVGWALKTTTQYPFLFSFRKNLWVS